MLVLAPALLLASLVSASAHGPSHGHHQHAALAARRAGLLAHERALGELVLPPSGAAPRKRADKRCKVRDSSLTTPSSSSQAQAAATSASSSQAPEAPKTTSAAPEPSSTKAEEPAPTTSSTPAPVLVVAPTSTKKEEPKETSTPSNNNNNGGDVSHSSNGLLNINDITCGWSGATSETTNDSGPNGKESWLTCGLQGGGWTPPFISLGELKYADLGEVIGQGNSPFQPCAPYIDQFYQVAQQYGIPPILIASIAMQESTCNPSVTGGGGEQGMFQISQDKCGGAPGGNCKDVSYNMNTAMKYLSDTINQFGGSVLKAVGQYNGWTEGLTVDRATAARYSGCCRCQNNLDYPHQLLNGWMQGRNGNDIGTHFNLRVC